jgi:arylsulfatase A-like enzyme
MIVIDTLRADRLGAYGNTRGLTPFLDRLAERGTVFRNAYATSSWTPPSIASLFTSRFPSQHKVVQGASKLAADETTFAEKLIEHGYTTAGFSANLRLAAELGFGQGFDRWISDDRLLFKPRGDFLRQHTVEWADGTYAERRPAPGLLYLQYVEPHAPYKPPEPFRGRFGRADAGEDEIAVANRKLIDLNLSSVSEREGELLESYYDAEVAAADAEVALLFAELEQRNFLDDAIVLVTADHGEEFRDHGSFSHGTSLYNEVVRVPLILLAPGFQPGHVVERNVSLVDVAPTILDLVHLPPEGRFEGRSLVPLLLKKGSLFDSVWPEENVVFPDMPVLLELLGPEYFLPFRHTAGLIDGGTKLLANARKGVRELFDLTLDPQELSPRSSAEVAALAVTLSDILSSLRDPRQTAEQVKLDKAVRERMRALGYSF